MNDPIDYQEPWLSPDERAEYEAAFPPDEPTEDELDAEYASWAEQHGEVIYS